MVVLTGGRTLNQLLGSPTARGNVSPWRSPVVATGWRSKENITIRQVMCHEAGLYDIRSMIAANNAGQRRLSQVLDQIARAGREGRIATYQVCDWKTPLAAFRIRFEYRLFGDPLPGIKDWQASNSGLMFHSQAPDTMRRDQDFPVSLEFQLLGVPRPVREPSGNLCTPGTTVLFDGKRDPRHCIPSSSPLLPVGRWTRAELEVLPNGDITQFIDGKAVLRYAAPELDAEDKDAQPLIAAAGGKVQLRKGYIALQGEGHQIEFRNIELQLLD